MDVCNDVSMCADSVVWEDLLNLDCSFESYEDLQNRYSKLQETYLKEVENSKKVKKNLEKCLKFYSKLCKKFEAQQKTIITLEKNIKEKMSSLEESYKNQETLRGLIDVYKNERRLYAGESNYDLRRDKEMLLEICCQLITESVKTNNIKNITNLILRKFKKDLNDDKLNLLKGKQTSIKKEFCKFKESNYEIKNNKAVTLTNNTSLNNFNDFKSDILEFKEEKNFSPPEYSMNEEKMHSAECHGKVGDGKNGIQIMSDATFQNCDKNKNFSHLIEGAITLSDLISSPVGEINDKKEIEGDPSMKEKPLEQTMSLSLPFLESSFVTRSQSEAEKVSDCELDINKQFNENCDKINEFSNVVVENSHSHLKTCSPVPVVYSKIDLVNALKENGKENSCKIMNCEEMGSSKALEKISRRDNNNVKLNVFPEGESARENVPQNEISHSNFKDCDSLKSKVSFSENTNENASHDAPNDNLNKNSNILDDKPKTNASILIQVNTEKNSSSFYTYSREKSKTDCLSPRSSQVQKFNQSIFDLTDEANVPSRENNAGILLDETMTLEFGSREEIDNAEESSVTNEEELSLIFKETSLVRLLSPIRDLEKSSNRSNWDRRRGQVASFGSEHPEPEGEKLSETAPKLSHSSPMEKRKNSSVVDVSRNKKFKVNECEKIEKRAEESGPSFVDSIITAMTIQNEELKANNFHEVNLLLEKFENHRPCFFGDSGSRASTERQSSDSDCFPMRTEGLAGGERTMKDEKRKSDHRDPAKSPDVEKILDKRLRNFVTATYSSKEETDKAVKDCLMVLAKSSVEAIARVIVSIVFENINEEVVPRERPVPPLTKTQNHLIILLSVFKTEDSRYETVIGIILSKITEKLFPDKFQWPDDSVETASRFFVALCKHRNETKAFWKFCLTALSEMKQRSCLVFLVALKTWPDTLFNASTGKNNILAVTAVNLFLHMPKGNRNDRQCKRLLALKRLLQDFYEFTVDDTIENFASKLLDSLSRGETAADKSVVLLANCRDVAWTGKNVLSRLLAHLTDWKTCSPEENSKGRRILRVLEQIMPNFLTDGKNPPALVTKTIFCLSELLNSQKLGHESEQEIVETLLVMKRYLAVRNIIREWVPREAISENLRNEIVNVAAENALREIKFNRNREDFGKRNRGNKTNKKRNKKPKGKTKFGKSRKGAKTLGSGNKKGKKKIANSNGVISG